jgi:hypothetical protein
MKGGIMGEKWLIKFSLTFTTSTEIVRNFLHAAKLRHGTGCFTSPPTEGQKIWWLRPGLNPQTWVPEASMLTTRPPKPLLVCTVVNLLASWNARSFFNSWCGISFPRRLLLSGVTQSDSCCSLESLSQAAAVLWSHSVRQPASQSVT